MTIIGLVGLLSGCGDGVLIVRFSKVPADTHSIALSVTLQNKGSLVQEPQEDVHIEGSFDELYGLRYPGSDVSIARVNAKALNDADVCLGKGMQTIEFAGPGKHYVSIDFEPAAVCD